MNSRCGISRCTMGLCFLAPLPCGWLCPSGMFLYLSLVDTDIFVFATLFPAISFLTSYSASAVLLWPFLDLFLIKLRWAQRMDINAATARECLQMLSCLYLPHTQVAWSLYTETCTVPYFELALATSNWTALPVCKLAFRWMAVGWFKRYRTSFFKASAFSSE